MKTYTNLNANEAAILKAVVLSSEGNGGDFTYFSDVMKEVSDLTDKQVKGYISQLAQKKYIYVSDDRFCQICASGDADNLLDYEF